MDLAAQAKAKGGKAKNLISTTEPCPNLVVLKGGDPLPAGVTAFETDQIASFLSSYVRDGHIQLGPLQIIYLFDLDAKNTSSSKYNLQDLGVLVDLKVNETTTTHP